MLQLVTAAGYLPSGPLSSLALGNGLTETRAFDQRYFPSAITLTGAGNLLSWTYTTDAVGNILTMRMHRDDLHKRNFSRA